MKRIDDIIAYIREMAPEDLAEPWDNCGLIVASEREYTERVITCLDVTMAVVKEAVEIGAHLIIAHHPLIFTPIRRIDRIGEQSEKLRALIGNDIALYAAHTNVDKTYGGLNDLLAGIIGVKTPAPDDANETLNYYRVGDLPYEFDATEFDEYVLSRLKLRNIIVSAQASTAGFYRSKAGSRTIKKVMVMCGSYSLSPEQFFDTKADALLCGEIKYHDALDLIGMGVHVVQAGHHGTERFFMNLTTKWILDKFPDLQVQGVGFTTPPMEVYYGRNVNGDV